MVGKGGCAIHLGIGVVEMVGRSRLRLLKGFSALSMSFALALAASDKLANDLDFPEKKESKEPKAPSFLLLSTSSSSSSCTEEDEAAPMEELSEDSSATLLPKKNPFLFGTSSTSSSSSSFFFAGRTTWSLSPTLGSTREDIIRLLRFSFFPSPPPPPPAASSPPSAVNPRWRWCHQSAGDQRTPLRRPGSAGHGFIHGWEPSITKRMKEKKRDKERKDKKEGKNGRGMIDEERERGRFDTFPSGSKTPQQNNPTRPLSRTIRAPTPEPSRSPRTATDVLSYLPYVKQDYLPGTEVNRSAAPHQLATQMKETGMFMRDEKSTSKIYDNGGFPCSGSSPHRQEDSWAHDGEMTGHGGSCRTFKDESVPRGKDRWMSLQVVQP
ncbi:hypothetical protein MUK42_32353 [Musa troglodytarum]|uniref:Uncharacterized protein n=1 Tax=Musa troglodytarum TaxID=320322 RepID=A0A9E7FJV5_9LILI|nr:hypothetical protein MUK42_32353 [Musa troglodytarum]